MAATNAGDALAGAFDGAVFAHGLNKVVAARRSEAAVSPHHRAKQHLIAPHTEDQQPGKNIRKKNKHEKLNRRARV